MIWNPLNLSLQRIIPTAPARRACIPLLILEEPPLKQTKIFPFTLEWSNVSGLQRMASWAKAVVAFAWAPVINGYSFLPANGFERLDP